MSNLVTSERVPGTAPLHMSNGLTDVFVEVLAIAASDRATTEWEKSFAYWVVRNDQNRSGRGCVGFDVASMGWTPEDFLSQKRFVLEVVDAARAKSGWERLSYEPHEEILTTLAEFRAMIDAFPAEAAGADSQWEWTLPPSGMCETHRVYLHEAGCLLCGG